MKKRSLAILLSLSMAAVSMMGAATTVFAEEKAEEEPVELTLWVTSRDEDDFEAEMDAKFEEEHPWITLNKIVKEGDPGNEFYQAVAAGNAPDLVNCSFTMMDTYMKSGILGFIRNYP